MRFHRLFELITPILISFSVLLLLGCGSHSSSQLTAVTPAVPLLPAIAASQPVLLFNGTGTSSDVSAVEGVLSNLSIGYNTANSAQIEALSEQQLAGYKLIIIPGGNSITIGQNLSAAVASNIREQCSSTALTILEFVPVLSLEPIPSITASISPGACPSTFMRTRAKASTSSR